MHRIHVHLTRLLSALFAFSSFVSLASAKEPALLAESKFTDPRIAVAPSQLMRAIEAPEAIPLPKFMVSEEKQRSLAAQVYSAVAPAICVVHFRDIHGTGFVIDPDGWLITNRHVIEDAPIDPQTGARTASINFGNLVNGLMQLQETRHPALVYQVSEARDLALLKLASLPAGNLPVLPFSQQKILPGLDCVAIGHPKAGLLWTARSGEVAGIGDWPHDMMDLAMAKLQASGGNRDQLLKILAHTLKRRVVVSTCGVNPGDSGGPLVDSEGRLIAVTFAIPKGGAGQGISLDKFSYHVHVDELKEFLAERPERPEFFVPDVWPAAVYSAFGDRDKDGRPDGLLFGTSKEQISAFLVDLDQDSPKDFDLNSLSDKSNRTKWDFEFAYHRAPRRCTFYDTDNDGSLDRILIDTTNDGLAEIVLALQGDQWRRDTDATRQDLFDASLFKDNEMLHQRFTQLVLGK